MHVLPVDAAREEGRTASATGADSTSTPAHARDQAAAPERSEPGCGCSPSSRAPPVVAGPEHPDHVDPNRGSEGFRPNARAVLARASLGAALSGSPGHAIAVFDAEQLV